MKVKIYGGPLSLSYNLAKSLRRGGIDATLYTDKLPQDVSYRPEWEDDGVSADWIGEVDLSFRNCVVKGKREKTFIEELRDSDILHMYGEGSIWASFTGVPYVYSSYGYDLDQIPFRKSSLKDRVLAYYLKRSVLKSRCVIVPPHHKELLKKLKWNIKISYAPCPIDTDKYKKVKTPLRDELKNKGNYDFIFFSPTRHEWTHSHASNKGNDRLINAFAKFNKLSGKKALLILAEKGDDLEKSKILVKERGMETDVMWIKPQKKDALIEFYSASDIVFDQFTLGEFGQVLLEAMACAAPTFIYLKGYEGFYDEDPPCVNVSTEDQICEKLMDLTGDPEALKGIGERSREWIVKNHDWRVSVERYKKLYESILGER